MTVGPLQHLSPQPHPRLEVNPQAGPFTSDGWSLAVTEMEEKARAAPSLRCHRRMEARGRIMGSEGQKRLQIIGR